MAALPDAMGSFLNQPMGSQLYTTNAACSKNRCINPVFPGVEDLHALTESQWQCSTLKKTAEAMSFCGGTINYDPALKSSTVLGETIPDRVRKQDAAASEAFFYHLSGLGLEPWDYNKPDSSSDECIKSIWRMVCYTHFPRASVGCVDGSPSRYMRPCQSSCQNYVAKCGVECCDEGVQCVFDHQKKVKGQLVMTQGYAPYDGPSSLCTGAAARSVSFGLVPLVLLLQLAASFFGSAPAASQQSRGATRKTTSSSKRKLCASSPLFFVVVVLALAPVLPVSALKVETKVKTETQKAAVNIPSHTIANWRTEPDYLIKYEFVPPGGNAQSAKLNSCSINSLSTMLQCSGRGVCRSWTDDATVTKHPARFCDCDRDWADPECRTRRKSQMVAFGLSLFLGMFGADQFYLGFPAQGFLKMFTGGGCGLWWAVDVIRIGSGPVPTPSFRVAADFPHWAFALITITFAMLVGFTIAYFTTVFFRARRRKDALMLQAEEEHHIYKAAKEGSKVKKSNLRGQQAQSQAMYDRRDGFAAAPQSVVL